MIAGVTHRWDGNLSMFATPRTVLVSKHVSTGPSSGGSYLLADVFPTDALGFQVRLFRPRSLEVIDTSYIETFENARDLAWWYGQERAPEIPDEE